MTSPASRSHRTTGEARPVHPVYPAWQPPSTSRASNTGPLPAPEPGFVPDVIIVGHGLSGLVATYEASRAGKKVLVVDQENEKNLGGQAYWSLGGLFLVDTPEQRRIGIKDSLELAWRDWLGSAGFDRPEDHWPRQWARAYVEFAAGEKRRYLHDLGLRIIPTVGWAERGGGDVAGHGNSVPRFHVTWGTGPEVVRVFEEPVLDAARAGLVRFAVRHRVDEIIVENDRAVGVRGVTLAPCDYDRGVASPREETGQFEFRAKAVLLASGGIGGNPDLVRKYWPADRLGAAPEHLIVGVPEHVDGRMLEISEMAGAHLINRDRMWHYTEGVANFAPVWPSHAIRIIPGPSTLWLDANGDRMPVPLFPGFHTTASIEAIRTTGYDYSWFILDSAIAGKEFILSGSEQNPELTDKSLKKFASKAGGGLPPSIADFAEKGVDWVVADTIEELVGGLNSTLREGEPELDVEKVREFVLAMDGQMDNPFAKDAQVQAIHNSRRVLTDKLTRLAKPHRLLKHSGPGKGSAAGSGGPLIGVKVHLMTRKTLGGIETTLDSQCLTPDGELFPGLYAAGEAAGFGGGGVHGYNALEGTFLGGCIFSGMKAGRAMAREV
ncbi:FAD-binding dehydrogenase [Dietzia sp. ANT_WB102]|uniref:FAD-binding dehydrogenase n=1 Tax=Dietzia sp. ANT_WB102 TaxID=2597345 RepID=UPI0011EF4557|nr:FAD-binding dehydrogenase [Dietzia sp. ANT_WB102]KAA0917149.1 FAD-binding dehydrogenase [Dietzia sp. ANT_WB102]